MFFLCIFQHSNFYSSVVGGKTLPTAPTAGYDVNLTAHWLRAPTCTQTVTGGYVGWSGERDLTFPQETLDQTDKWLSWLHFSSYKSPSSAPPSEQINHSRMNLSYLNPDFIRKRNSKYSWELSIWCHPNEYKWKDAHSTSWKHNHNVQTIDGVYRWTTPLHFLPLYKNEAKISGIWELTSCAFGVCAVVIRDWSRCIEVPPILSPKPIMSRARPQLVVAEWNDWTGL